MSRRRLVDKVAETIMRRLAAGQWAPPAKFPSIRNLTVACGVSHRTTILAVQQLAQQGLLRVEQRKSIEVLPDAAEKARQLLAGGGIGQTSHRMAILYPQSIMPPSRNAFYSTLIRTITQQAKQRNTQVEVVPWSVQEQMNLADSLVRGGFDRALFLSFYHMMFRAVFTMYERGLPFIVFNRRVPGLPLPSVVFDRHLAAQNICQRLIALGHRNVCLMIHPHEYQEEMISDPAHGRGSAWLKCLKEHDLLNDCSMPLYIPWEDTLGLYSPAFRATMKKPNRPTAIVFGFSPWAKWFLNDPEFSHFRVPQDLSLMTFETIIDLPRVSWCPPMTHFEINHARTAECILETIERLAAAGKNVPTLRVPLDLRMTESVGPAPEQSGGATAT